MVSNKGSCPVPTPSSVYDDPEFFDGYRDLRMNDTGLNGLIEVPALRRRLPELAGLRVLDLGCGFGHFARWAADNGTESVVGIDASRRMIEAARELTEQPDVNYLHADMETLTDELGQFDLVVSSMALHYVQHLDPLLDSIAVALRESGKFIFSVEHPICTANPGAWKLDDHGKPEFWPLDRYQDRGERDTRWFVEGVRKYHRTVSDYVNALLEHGFMLTALDEPYASENDVKLRPGLELETRRPPILLLSAALSRPARQLTAHCRPTS